MNTGRFLELCPELVQLADVLFSSNAERFLANLNGAFQGQGTAETFSFTGKTDIFLRATDRGVFIAECKFWNGAAAFKSIIDQLLGYLTWRESKTAILLFVRNDDIGKVEGQIPDLVAAHPLFTKREA